LPFEYRNLGEQQLKGFEEPVRAYVASLAPGESPPRAESITEAAVAQKKRLHKHHVTGGVIALAVVVGLVAWLTPWQIAEEEATQIERVATPLDKPSIAVLPFVNMSSDAEQEYFSDGMTEDLITDLSKLSNLTVIARTSTAGYKGQEVDVREVGKVLGVRYVIEGSVRKAGSDVRINAQLIDATNGDHVWAERYDGDLNDIFSLQDKVLAKIVGALALTLSQEERRRLAARGTDSVAAYDLYLKGLFEESKFTRESNQAAVRLYEQALAIDPDYPLPYARLSNVFQQNPRNGWSDDIEGDLKKAVELAEKAVSLDGQNPHLYWMLGRAHSKIQVSGALDRGIEAMERAIELDPDFADAYAFLGDFYMGSGRAEDGLRAIAAAMKLNPRYPFWYLFIRGTNHYMLEDYESAISDFEAAVDRSPTAHFLRWWLAASFAQLGLEDDAEWQVDELMSMGFDGSVATITETGTVHHADSLRRYKEGLRKAGIREK
jgi:adenylate cyclase